jgi:hypothetical protein
MEGLYVIKEYIEVSLMPTRPPEHKPVSHRAPVHKVAGTAASESWREWYTHSRWRKIRDRQLTLEPLCRFCAAKGLVVEATVCDHVERHGGDKVKFYSGPFQSLCKRCHDSTKKRIDNQGAGTGSAPREPVFA